VERSVSAAGVNTSVDQAGWKFGKCPKVVLVWLQSAGEPATESIDRPGS